MLKLRRRPGWCDLTKHTPSSLGVYDIAGTWTTISLYATASSSVRNPTLGSASTFLFSNSEDTVPKTPEMASKSQVQKNVKEKGFYQHYKNCTNVYYLFLSVPCSATSVKDNQNDNGVHLNTRRIVALCTWHEVWKYLKFALRSYKKPGSGTYSDCFTVQNVEYIHLFSANLKFCKIAYDIP